MRISDWSSDVCSSDLSFWDDLLTSTGSHVQMSTLSSTLKIRVGKVYSLWPLHIREIQAAKPKDKPYGLTDGSGLFLWVTPKGQKYWQTGRASCRERVCQNV